MDRMKTFLTYALLIIGFFILSNILEDGLLLAMYSKISGTFDGYYEEINDSLSIKDTIAKACNINGYLNFDLINSTESYIDKAYMKVDLYNKQNLLADTEYIEILEMQPGDSKNYNIKFKANNIEKFNISIIKNTPDKANIIDILGWEVDLSDVFGLGIDLTDVTIFGTKLSDLFKWSNVKSKGQIFFLWFLQLVRGIPWWGYGIGWLYIVGLL